MAYLNFKNGPENGLGPLGVKKGCFEAILSLKSSKNFRD
jgi:hypothetical protein